MRLKQHSGRRLTLVIACLCAGCTPLSDAPATAYAGAHSANTDNDLSPERAGTVMSQAARLDNSSAQREIIRLRPDMAQRTVAERLQLAYLLSREPTGMNDLQEANRLLDELIPALENSGTRTIARLLQHNVRLQLRLAEEHSRAARLDRKIQQLKGLEEELQQHNFSADPPPAAPAP